MGAPVVGRRGWLGGLAALAMLSAGVLPGVTLAAPGGQAEPPPAATPIVIPLDPGAAPQGAAGSEAGTVAPPPSAVPTTATAPEPGAAPGTATPVPANAAGATN